MTVGYAHLLISDQTRDRSKKLRYIPNIQRLTEEDSIPWFDICGWRFSEDQDNDIGSSDRIKTLILTGY